MSYIGGSQFSVDNRTDQELSSCIDRMDMMEKIKADIMPMGYTGRVQANSSANYARGGSGGSDYFGQLPNMGVNTRDTSLLQGKGFKDDVIDASSRATQSASRFNYALDRQINKRYVDVSGQFIPNNKLRILPNRSCSMWSGGQPKGELPSAYTDPNLYKLSNSLITDAINLQYNPANANKYLMYKANKPKLTRQDLMDAAQQYTMMKPQALAGATGTTVALGASYDPLASARQRQQMRDEIAANLREMRGLREGTPPLSVQIPRQMQVGALP